MKARILSFTEERNATMFSLDRRRIEAYMKKYGMQIPNNDIVFWAGVYKCIYNINEAPTELKAKAAAWLQEHGMSPRITI